MRIERPRFLGTYPKNYLLPSVAAQSRENYHKINNELYGKSKIFASREYFITLT